MIYFNAMCTICRRPFTLLRGAQDSCRLL
ncbi:hypothetical protein F3G63_36610 [Pseudomonas aeruginosa]|nr:hypothetical protein F3G63_36610 [Pseudomonas aeruginosa]